MFEEDFIVRTHREGSIQADQKCESIMSQMGCTVMNSRSLGSVVAIAELENGVITKEKIRWGQGNDPAFDKDLAADAQALLAAAKGALLASGNGPGDIKLKVVGKK